MRQRFGRPTPSGVISVIALFVALGGTSYAVAKNSIGSREIKNNSVLGKDIKKGTVKSSDISDATEAALKGQPGQQGQQGQKGPQGPQGPSTVRWAANTDSSQDIATCSDTSLDACPSLLTVAVPAGKHLVQATTGIDVFSGVPQIIDRCGIHMGSDLGLDEQRLSLAPNGTAGETESIALSRVINPGAATNVSLRCTEQAGEVLRLEQPRLTALQVGSTVP